MAVSACSRMKSLHDMWCRNCGHASRLGQWVPGNDSCPFCGVSAAQRVPWALLRLYHPDLPLRPETGNVYHARARK